MYKVYMSNLRRRRNSIAYKLEISPLSPVSPLFISSLDFKDTHLTPSIGQQ